MSTWAWAVWLSFSRRYPRVYPLGATDDELLLGPGVLPDVPLAHVATWGQIACVLSPQTSVWARVWRAGCGPLLPRPIRSIPLRGARADLYCARGACLGKRSKMA